MWLKCMPSLPAGLTAPLRFPAGKTTLLDVLAGRKTVGTLSGEILFGGVKPSKMFLRRFTGYVEQFGEGLGFVVEDSSR